MARWLPAVAVTLVLALGGGIVVTSACEIACSSAASIPHETGSRPSPSASGSRCHDLGPASGGRTLLTARTSDATCGRATAAPFVVPSTSFKALKPAARQSRVDATHSHPPAAYGAWLRLHEHAPPESSPARGTVLRI